MADNDLTWLEMAEHGWNGFKCLELLNMAKLALNCLKGLE